VKVSVVTGPGETQVIDVPKPTVGQVAALNEPMAVARHGVNSCQPKPSDKVVVFGAGPIGLGATIGFKSAGVSHVVVADLLPARLEKALAVGADAVINSATDDVAHRLIELHGAVESIFPGKVGTDIYFDAAGAPAVINTALAAAKPGARLGVVAVHKQPSSDRWAIPTRSSKSLATSSPTGKDMR
jgi:threonine dehydrogenase-like Zn-dependent dehydrogenase